MVESESAPRRHSIFAASPQYKYMDSLVTVFVVILVISNVMGQKICAFGPLRVSGAQVLFPITYIFGDIFTEVYGYAASRKAIWFGFFASVLLSLMSIFCVLLPAAPEWPNQKAFATVFYTVPRLVVASLLAYWCGEFANSYTLAKMKLITEGKHLWMRTIGSTVVGQAVDSTIVMFVGFYGVVPVSTIVRLIISGYLAKVIYEAVMTPLTYLVVDFLKRKENVDHFDYKTDFNPFVASE
ncbi:MAG TPA: queuosine precursor transporter [Bryobacteraceae bacterium]|nr:queuosine precursor transporter [Bryobacteraceae bacterium]